MRRTRNAKIVATLGPASSDLETVRRLFLAGADVFRLNFSHGSTADHRARVEIFASIEVHDIDNDGLISGRGFFNGESRAFVLTPTEPGGGQCPVTQSALRAAVAAVKERFGG